MLKNQFKIAWRSLRKRKGFTLINILGLSLGFGCSILVFLFVQHHLRFDNFHNNSDRIYRFATEEHRDFIEYEAAVPPGFANAFRQDYDYAEKVAKYVDRRNYLITLDGYMGRKQFTSEVAFVEPEFFDIFNFPLVDGSNGAPIAEPNTAMITEEMAKLMFGDTNPINQTFEIENNQTITITAVLQDLPNNTFVGEQIFVSFETLKSYDEFMSSETWGGLNSSLHCFALMRPNQDIAQIENQLQGYVQKYRPNTKNVHHYKVQPLAQTHLDSRYEGGIDTKTLWIFSLVGLFILIVACINFINISTAQSTYRSKEVGVRKVLGSFKNQLFWQFMAETFIVSVLALVIGIGMCVSILPSFNTLFDLELSITTLFQLKFAGFVILLLGLVTLLAGSYPGLLLARIAPVLALKRKVSQNDAGGYVTRKALVVVQFAISIVLIIGSIVVSKQLKYAIDSDLGFTKDGMVMIEIPEYIELTQLNGLKERIAQNSSVANVTACFGSPGASNNNWGTGVVYNNRPEPEEFSLQVKAGDKNYIEAFDLELVAGRNFYEKDSVDELVVNETFVRKVGASSPQEILGKPLSINGGSLNAKIVGVVADFHDRDFHSSINPIFIAPAPQIYSELAVKINLASSDEALSHIEKEWSALFPDYLFDYAFLDENVAELYETEQRFLSLIGVFSGIAIFIGCLGIYGLILFFVVQKTKEIGIRKVLGGSIQHLVALVMQDFLKLIVIAGIIATPIAWYFMHRWLENFEYRTAINWWVFVLAVAIIMTITLATISYQAIKAALTNPVKSLRTE
ncbi:ABC transporter permease [Flagellimonas zhangzhouensis]|uniref:Duplicated orphan permease n=1 Tax=Flagellimonas zhangzhouensis TaxID=1073328 RepID=A0A1H2UX90_9FLAO|nr:ABC transporter permease [Allomuricauda zhangzhouensis]SDQ12798.1 duplicated orphan permease [Allomuricauda zhangzhouensis]SDW60702.1 duplicated orphan permease [Allomuricauda zhangzhouensis]